MVKKIRRDAYAYLVLIMLDLLLGIAFKWSIPVLIGFTIFTEIFMELLRITAKLHAKWSKRQFSVRQLGDSSYWLGLVGEDSEIYKKDFQTLLAKYNINDPDFLLDTSLFHSFVEELKSIKIALMVAIGWGYEKLPQKQFDQVQKSTDFQAQAPYFIRHSDGTCHKLVKKPHYTLIIPNKIILGDNPIFESIELTDTFLKRISNRIDFVSLLFCVPDDFYVHK